MATLKRELTDEDIELLLRDSRQPATAPRKGPLLDISNATMTMSQEDDMKLLLGGSSAYLAATSTTTQALRPTTIEGAPSATSATTGGMRIGALPWNGRKGDRDVIPELFEGQLAFELGVSRELESAFSPFVGRKRRTESSRQLAIPDAFSVSSPAGLALRSYQVEGVQFMLRAFSRGMSCILADDMGLGKTAQIATLLRSLLLHFGVRGPHLIIVPLSTLTGWCRELHRWAPELRIVKYHGDRKSRSTAMHSRDDRHSVFLTTPAVANGDSNFFRSQIWACCIVDEAHILKNSDTNVNRLAAKLRCAFRCAVTGTPIQNTPQEVASIMRFLYPTLCKNSPFDGTEAAAPSQCSLLLRHIMLRRTKAGVELGLPPRTDEPITMVEPTPLQRQLLETLSSRARESRNDELANLYMQARKLCNHPHMVSLLATSRRNERATAVERLEGAGVPLTEEAIVLCSAKMMQLDCMLKSMHGANRVLIFSNFTSQLDLLEGYCHLRGFSYERLDGTCNRVERELSMIRFNDPRSNVFIFLVTTTAGGVGVTLTGADTVVLFDAHHNPQIDRQAADRAHRIGQTRPVRIYRLCLQGTVEESVLGVAQAKANLGDLIVDGKVADEVRANFFSHAELRQMLTTMSASPSTQRGSRRAGMAPAAATVVDTAPTSDELTPWEQATFSRIAGSLFDPGCGADRSDEPRRGRVAPMETSVCFSCGGRMKPLEPLLHCSLCPKAFHADCAGENPADSRRARWVCPRHACSECDKKQSTDGALFFCMSCPSSFCFDCLDDRFFEVVGAQGSSQSSGTGFRYISKSYPEMAEEGVQPSRERYYVTCLECLGLVTSPDTDSSDDDDDDDETSTEDGEWIADDGEVELLAGNSPLLFDD